MKYCTKFVKFIRKDDKMDNNKNRMRDRGKSKSELRKMEPRDNADVGRKNGFGPKKHDGGNEKLGH